MHKIHTHYDNLKVARNAPPEVIKAAYKTLSHKYHPDRNPDSPDATRIMAVLNGSYEVLSDPEKREQHNVWIADQESAQTVQNKPPKNPESTGASQSAKSSINYNTVVSHILRNWLLYGAVVAIILVIFYDQAYSPPLTPKPYIANPTPEIESATASPSWGRPKQGDIVDGYVFNGGEPSDEKNWTRQSEKDLPKSATASKPERNDFGKMVDVARHAPNGNAWPTVAGYVRGYEKLNTKGLSSVTVDNTRNDSDVFVKLVNLNTTKAYPVRQFFIPAYGKFKVANVTAGQYDIRYRDLSSGSLSRSESFTLEEVATSDRTRFSNFTMTLYKVRDGNMKSYGLSEAEF